MRDIHRMSDKDSVWKVLLIIELRDDNWTCKMRRYYLLQMLW